MPIGRHPRHQEHPRSPPHPGGELRTGARPGSAAPFSPPGSGPAGPRQLRGKPCGGRKGTKVWDKGHGAAHRSRPAAQGGSILPAALSCLLTPLPCHVQSRRTTGRLSLLLRYPQLSARFSLRNSQANSLNTSWRQKKVLM